MNRSMSIRFSLFLGTVLLTTVSSCAFEEINLIPTEQKRIEVPKSYTDSLETINRENLQLKQNEKSVYFKAEEEIFENKAGKAFSKFINDKAINNKLNKMYSDVESRFLDEDY